MTKHPGLAATQLGRVCYEILRVLTEVKDEAAREHALKFLEMDKGANRFRAEVFGHIFYGRTDEEARRAALMMADTGESEPYVKVTAL